jgi:hypothetical protein
MLTFEDLDVFLALGHLDGALGVHEVNGKGSGRAGLAARAAAGHGRLGLDAGGDFDALAQTGSLGHDG